MPTRTHGFVFFTPRYISVTKESTEERRCVADPPGASHRHERPQIPDVGLGKRDGGTRFSGNAHIIEFYYITYTNNRMDL